MAWEREHPSNNGFEFLEDMNAKNNRTMSNVLEHYQMGKKCDISWKQMAADYDQTTTILNFDKEAEIYLDELKGKR